MYCIIMHGMSAHLEQGFGASLIKRMESLGLNVITPHFPLKEEITFKAWEETAKKYLLFFQNSVVICHSLSTLFILKFFKKYKLKCKILITIAGGYAEKIDDPKFLYLIDFIPTKQDFEYAKENIPFRYSFYSDNDDVFSQKNLSDYISLLSSNGIFLKNHGHFGQSSKVTDIPEIETIVKNILVSN